MAEISGDKTTFTSLVSGYDSDGSKIDIQPSDGETYFSETTTTCAKRKRNFPRHRTALITLSSHNGITFSAVSICGHLCKQLN